jgi:hypothetical protein
MQMKNNNRLMSRIINELDIIERRDKTIAEAEIQLAIQKDLEKQKETKEERKARAQVDTHRGGPNLK